MDRLAFLPCLYRDRNGKIRETAYPKGEPDPYDVPADLYCPSYEIHKGLFGPPRLKSAEVVIFNTRGYRPDPGLEHEAKVRLVREIISKEPPEIVHAAGGSAGIENMIDTGTFWIESPSAPGPPAEPP